MSTVTSSGLSEFLTVHVIFLSSTMDVLGTAMEIRPIASSGPISELPPGSESEVIERMTMPRVADAP